MRQNQNSSQSQNLQGNNRSSQIAGNHYKPNDNSDQQSNPRGIDSRPAWMTTTSNSAKEETKSKRQRLFVLCGNLLNTVAIPNMRLMPLSLDNDLPSALFRFGTSDNDEIPFPCHLDSCAAMNTGSLVLHQWIITNYPEIVQSYEQFDDNTPFAPISLACAVPSADSKKNENKLTAVVTYKTRYFTKEGKRVTLSFGLGLGIKVNAIVGLPTFREWRLILDLDSNQVTSKLLGLIFDLTFNHAATGFPEGVTFNTSQFV